LKTDLGSSTWSISGTRHSCCHGCDDAQDDTGDGFLCIKDRKELHLSFLNNVKTYKS